MENSYKLWFFGFHNSPSFWPFVCLIGVSKNIITLGLANDVAVDDARELMLDVGDEVKTS